MYDDMCHLHPCAKNLKKSLPSPILDFYESTLNHCVDGFHFGNHVDPVCKSNYNPYNAKKESKLENVNSQACEQAFKWINRVCMNRLIN